MNHRYRVIVIGGGHAGAEAAWAAANLLPESEFGAGAVGLVTLDPGTIGVMSCNPAIGGLAKGQLVREIDALGGLMGLCADAAGIMFRVLNQSRGPAVRGPRCQCDKHAYAQTVRAMLESRPEIQIIPGRVERFIVERGAVKGVEITPGPSGRAPGASADGGVTPSVGARHLPRREPGRRESHVLPEDGQSVVLHADAVVLTTGTFMRGLMHVGETSTEGGRSGEAAAVGISAALRELGFELGRLKTGTPPRLDRNSIDWDGLEPQDGDAEPVPFSELTAAGGARAHDPVLAAFPADDRFPALPARFPALEQVSCRVTRTTSQIHDLIRANLHRAPMYSGRIESVGPRYCPSIEDKVVRFASRDAHHVFLEPESLRDDWIYCNGISTSLPADVQEGIVRGMPGCERAAILRHGYAVEYDMVRPHQIHATGMTKLIEGLFLAGQINGTSGYEEAAGQGVVAGVNAAMHALGRGEWVPGRDEAYIGVMMDDLVTKTPTEPYRMFTSRAEHRLVLRADNAPDRLTPVAQRLGLLDTTALGRARAALFALRREQMRRLDALIGAARVDGVPVAELVRRPEFGLAELQRAVGMNGFLPDVWQAARADRLYAAYIERQRAEIRRQRELESKRIPRTVDYARFAGLRAEARSALTLFRPSTLGQAGRLEGVTPADVVLLSVLLRKRAAGSGG